MCNKTINSYNIKDCIIINDSNSIEYYLNNLA